MNTVCSIMLSSKKIFIKIRQWLGDGTDAVKSFQNIYSVFTNIHIM